MLVRRYTKILHIDSKVVDIAIGKIEARFGKTNKRRRKKHTFVGMNIYFMDNGRVKILMKGYLEEIIVVFGEDLGPRQVNTPTKI